MTTAQLANRVTTLGFFTPYFLSRYHFNQSISIQWIERYPGCGIKPVVKPAGYSNPATAILLLHVLYDIAASSSFDSCLELRGNFALSNLLLLPKQYSNGKTAEFKPCYTGIVKLRSICYAARRCV